MPNQFTGKRKSEEKGKVNGELTPKQRRFLLNLATERFKSIATAAVDAGYSISWASSSASVWAKEYRHVIQELKEELWSDETQEEAKASTRLAKKVLRELALHADNANVKRLAARDLLELAGVLRAPKGQQEDDIQPKDLRQAAHAVATKLLAQEAKTPVN